jgi:DNA-binding transcriptional LysR family regulator
MPSADRLKEFVAIANAGSIWGAARSLGIPRSTLSRRLSALEQDLGVLLIHRQTRRLVLTEAGEELVRRARRISADADAAWAAVRRLDDTPRGLLRVSVTAVTDTELFIDLLRDFPEISLEVSATTRHVDVIAEGVDVAMRFGEVTDPDLIVRRVGTVLSGVVASPDYLRRRGRPKTPDDLRDHECIVSFTGDWQPMRTWPLLDGGSVAVGGRLACNTANLICATVLAGEGLALLPRRLVRRDLEDKRLLTVLEQSVGTKLPVSLVYANREYVDAKVRVFVDRAAKRLTSMLVDAG